VGRNETNLEEMVWLLEKVGRGGKNVGRVGKAVGRIRKKLEGSVRNR